MVFLSKTVIFHGISKNVLPSVFFFSILSFVIVFLVQPVFFCAVLAGKVFFSPTLFSPAYSCRTPCFGSLFRFFTAEFTGLPL